MDQRTVITVWAKGGDASGRTLQTDGRRLHYRGEPLACRLRHSWIVYDDCPGHIRRILSLVALGALVPWVIEYKPRPRDVCLRAFNP